jgi:hypothetical protein
MDKVDQSSNTSRTAKGAGTVLYIAAGWSAAAVSVVVYPFIFGAAAIILGIRVSQKGSRAGMPLVAASILLMAVGLMLNNAVYDYLKNAIGI